MTIKLKLCDKVLNIPKNENGCILVGDNDDYRLHFEHGLEKTVVFAVFRRDGRQQEIALDEGGDVKIPMWVLKHGFFDVGIYSDGFASTPARIYVLGSIMEDAGSLTEDPSPSLVEQLIEKVNGIRQIESCRVENSCLIISFTDGTQLNAGTLAGDYDVEKYDGAYDVTPMFSREINLETQNKLMEENVTVKKMPQYEVSNTEGGKTLILGDEYYGN